MAFHRVLPKTQTQLLRDHFRAKGSITALEASGIYKVRSLSRRINDLEEQGMEFHREQHVDETGQRYVRYISLARIAA